MPLPPRLRRWEHHTCVRLCGKRDQSVAIGTLQAGVSVVYNLGVAIEGDGIFKLEDVIQVGTRAHVCHEEFNTCWHLSLLGMRTSSSCVLD